MTDYRWRFCPGLRAEILLPPAQFEASDSSSSAGPAGPKSWEGAGSKYGIWNRLLPSFLDLLALRWMKSRWLRIELEEEGSRPVDPGKSAIGNQSSVIGEGRRQGAVGTNS